MLYKIATYTYYVHDLLKITIINDDYDTEKLVLENITLENGLKTMK